MTEREIMADTCEEFIVLSDYATTYLHHVVKKHAACGVVIALEKAGCAGYMYRVEPCQTPPQDCVLQVVSEELSLFVPLSSVPLLKGSQLDYVRSQLETKAVFNNPNVRMACGCGDSVEILV